MSYLPLACAKPLSILFLPTLCLGGRAVWPESAELSYLPAFSPTWPMASFGEC